MITNLRMELFEALLGTQRHVVTEPATGNRCRHAVKCQAAALQHCSTAASTQMLTPFPARPVSAGTRKLNWTWAGVLTMLIQDHILPNQINTHNTAHREHWA